MASLAGERKAHENAESARKEKWKEKKAPRALESSLSPSYAKITRRHFEFCSLPQINVSLLLS